MAAIKVRFDGKTFVPDRPVADIPAGAEAVVHYDPVPDAPSAEGGNRKPISVLEWVAENVIDDPSLPTDLSYQHDHYLYGTPKKPRP